MKRVGLIGLFISILLFVSCKQEVYFNISTKVLPEDGGSVVVIPSSGSVLEGTTVTFKANPNSEYVFTGWSGGLSGTENPKTVVAASDLNVVANFTLKTYPLTLSVEGEGTVTERVISTKTEYGSGTIVELSATPSGHWLFDHWEGDLNGNTNPIQITVSSPKSVKAIFVKKMYDLTVSVEGEGAVSEKVIETKSGSYQEGTIIELTATPSTGWSFDHWEGDITSTENPIQITISSAKSVKAVFTKNKYSLKIIGPGIVNETLIKTEPEIVVQLDAIPYKMSFDTEFLGWSGSISGNQQTIRIKLDTNMEITASFGRVVRQYPQPDLKSPWVSQKRLYPGVDFRGLTNDAADLLPVDYNKDGYVDVIATVTEDMLSLNNDCPVRFYKGGPDGLFTPDPVNDRKLIAEDPRKLMYCDFNDDGIPDFMTVGHGNENLQDPRAYPVAIISNPDGTYYDVRFTESVGYYHGSTLGDFDNDGDIDIFLMDASPDCTSAFWINDGTGRFTKNTSIVCDTGGRFTCELYDVDTDGYLDLIIGNRIVWGNGSTFAKNDFTDYVTYESDREVALDMDFYDLDGDGKEEFLLSTTDDYKSRRIQILERNGRVFTDVTNRYFPGNDHLTFGVNPALWIKMEELDGSVYLVGRMMDNGERLFQLINGAFVKVESEQDLADGLVLYCDGVEQVDAHWNPGCKDWPYLGSTCLKVSELSSWEGFSLWRNEADWVDYSSIEADDYCLEFAVRTSDPELEFAFNFETLLQTDPWYFPTYFYIYRAGDHNANGEWEVIQVPLKEFVLDEDWKNGYYWNTIKSIYISADQCHGKEFYLDEIRIRKVLLE